MSTFLNFANSSIKLEGNDIENKILSIDGMAPFIKNSSEGISEERIITVNFLNDIQIKELKPFYSFVFENDKIQCSTSSYKAEENGVTIFSLKMEQPTSDSCFYMEWALGSKQIIANQPSTPTLLRYGLWQMAGMALLQFNKIAIHSSVIVYKDKALLFLGESGTGKSTQTHLWEDNISGAEILNDDSPWLETSLNNGTLSCMVHGSPWSGKGTYYQDKHYPIAGIVRLVQAKIDQMVQLKSLASIGAILPSFPPTFSYNEELQESVMHILSEILKCVPIYKMECTPNISAVNLCKKTLFGDD